MTAQAAPALVSAAGADATLGNAAVVGDLALDFEATSTPPAISNQAVAPTHAPESVAAAPVRPVRRTTVPAREGALVLERSTLLLIAASIVVAAVVVGVRLYRLDTLQGEWYGDISTIYEYVMSIRVGEYPRDYYNLGVGPLYAWILRPLLALFGETYLGFKLAAVSMSLLGLAVLFLLCRRLRGNWFALVAVAVAGTGCWLLILSRLGDLQASVLVFTVAPLLLADRVTESTVPRPVSAAACGLLAGACIYLYGAVFMVPVLTTLMIVVALARPARFAARRRDMTVYFAALAVAALPMTIAYLRYPEAFAQGHFATRILRGPGTVATVAANAGNALMAYVTDGDVSYRSNSPRMTHVDPVSLVLAILGCVYWIRRRTGSRKWAAILIGGFLLMHVPSILVSSLEVPSSGRSIGAAAFLYVLVASGVWWIGEMATRGSSARSGAAVSIALLLTIATINGYRYFVRYVSTLPYGNTHVARAITSFVDLLPSTTSVYMVGPPWSPGGMPEPKSIRYPMRTPERFHEQPIETLTCSQLESLELPAVLVWSYETRLPSEGVRECADLVPGQLFVSDRDVPMFRAATVRIGPSDGDVPSSSAAMTAVARARPPAPAPPPLQWTNVHVDIGGVPAELRYLPIDMGEPAGMFDGNPRTVMRGAADNPYLLELRFDPPVLVSSFAMDLGFMPAFDVLLTATGTDGKETVVNDHQQPPPGSDPHSELVLPGGPLELTSALISIRDIRERPAEGYHIHIFELHIERPAQRAPSDQR
jgi:hypothetical protein